MKKALCLFFFAFSGCAPNSSDDFRHEGEARSRTLVSVLQSIENTEQLLRKEPELKKRFESLVALMIEAREFREKHPDQVESAYEEPSSADVGLEAALRRIYALEGGREAIERAQHEALVKLDAYERLLAKKRERDYLN